MFIYSPLLCSPFLAQIKHISYPPWAPKPQECLENTLNKPLTILKKEGMPLVNRVWSDF